MAIDPDVALAAPGRTARSEWDADRVMLYHLGVGAGAEPTDERELQYVYEPRLVVLPTFAMVPAADASTPTITGPGLDYDFDALLHGAQDLEMLAAVPTQATAVSSARIEAVYDKGHAAVFIVAVDTTLSDGTLMSRNRLSLFVQGAGGFGGDSGPKATEFPATPPTAHETEIATVPQLTAIFRLTGDRTPMHIDPAAARSVGLPRPTMPGLCTWGIAGKALIDELLDGDVTAVRGLSVRFAGPIYPGETVVVRSWPADGGIAFDSIVKERGTPLLSRGFLRTT